MMVICIVMMIFYFDDDDFASNGAFLFCKHLSAVSETEARDKTKRLHKQRSKNKLQDSH